MDFDGDGDTDLLSGSFPGELYVFRRNDDGSFAAPEVIENIHGSPDVRQGYLGRRGPCYNSTAFLHDWDGDGDGDLLVGRHTPLLLINQGTPAVPVFGDPAVPTVDGQPISRGFAHPIVADWDSDGRDDLLTGSGYDIVWYRNTATTGPPQLSAPQILVRASEVKAYGSRRRHDALWQAPTVPALVTGICVTDFNRDGRPDLLLGDFFGERVEFPEPTATQSATMAKARAARKLLDSGHQLRARPPQNESRPQRVARFRQAVDQWQAWQAATSASYEFTTKRNIRHGWVWLYERLPIEDDRR